MKFPATLIALALLLSACASTMPAARPSGSTLRGDAAHPESGVNWLRTELYFGIGPADDGNVAANEKRWRDFIDREVSSRFPDGLSVYDIYGQWRSQGHTDIERLHSKEVMLLYADTPQHRADIEAIRSAWKQATGDVSVLRVTQPADVSF
jgi:hypothetical protein